MDDKGTSRGHSALAHLHVAALGAGKQPAHTQHRLHPRAWLLLHGHILIPWLAGGRDDSLPAKPKVSSGFGMTPQPMSALVILHPQTVLQSVPRALCHGKDGPSWEGSAGSALLSLLDSSSGPPSKASPARSSCPSVLAKAWNGGYVRALAP